MDFFQESLQELCFVFFSSRLRNETGSSATGFSTVVEEKQMVASSPEDIAHAEAQACSCWKPLSDGHKAGKSKANDNKAKPQEFDAFETQHAAPTLLTSTDKSKLAIDVGTSKDGH
eukprot:CAMPEP_0113819972 /NCGR_PEP_ID=MMETSP0328-20130328/1006_1 /TAXON_ID=39455 /ORGANISM="Alexandrium minutum" /LENGTH=115 /DNA_ID=CAMNT_0000787905 /DNA_START=68 /DNA_END=415 /DNA_ORIENTATION=- /assembly_acc=CAM_ASM_000350